MIWAIARAQRPRDSDAADVSQATWLLLFEHLDRLNDPTRVSGTRSGALTVVTRAARLVQGQLTGRRALDQTPTTMIDNAQTKVAAIGVRLLDDAYLAWFSAESECESTLHGWFRAPGDLSAGAYLAYQAALEREEAAARDLQRLWRVARPCRETLLERYGAVCG